MSFYHLRPVISVFAFAALLELAGCKTTSASSADGTTVKAAADQDGESVPLLKIENLAPVALAQLVKVAKQDAEAMFGGKALLYLVALDKSATSGPCAGAFGARVLFANPDSNAEPLRAYAMFTVDPVQNGPESCGNASSTGMKSREDVRALTAGTVGLDAGAGGVGAIKVSLADAVAKVRAKVRTFEGAEDITITSLGDNLMKGSPWAVIRGKSCGGSGFAYVNLANGKLIDAARPFNTSCR